MEKKVARAQSSTPSHQIPNSAVSTKYSSANSPQNSHAGDFKGKSSNYNNRRENGGGRNSRYPAQNRGQRRPATNQQNYEVNRVRRDSRVTTSHSAQTAVAENRGGRHQRESASHLLNFTYAPLPSQESGGRAARRPVSHQNWRSGRSKQPIYTKQQFLQAHCQFVVKPPLGNEYVGQLADSDCMVEWEQIDQVILSDEQLASCPICLDVPVAAKITKCAHVYCWPCILHYLSLSEKAWAKCPICFDAIEEKDLKSVSVRTRPSYKVGDEISLYLMRKERDSLYVRPKSVWRANYSDHLHNINDEEVDVRYSKLLTSTVSYIDDLLKKERRQLTALLSQEETQSLEASYVQAALNSLDEQKYMHDKMSKTLASRESVSSSENVKELVPDTADKPEAEREDDFVQTIKAAPEHKVVRYSDAFDDNGEVGADHVQELSSVSPASSSEVMSPPSVSMSTSDVSLEGENQLQNPPRQRNESSTSSSDGGESEVAAKLTLPATGTQSSQRGNKRTEVYYFYQSADGQHVYLNSINTRMLAAEYGSLEMAPHTLTATILECEENSMTQDVRKRLKYLSHLPLYCPYTVCEVSLRPPVVSSATLTHFREEIDKRKRMRSRRQRAEAKQCSRAQAEERRRMGQYPDMALPLDSERHFPTSAPTMSEFLPLAEPVQPPADPPLDDLLSRSDVPLSTPFSFSQATRGGSGAPAPSWPRRQTAATYVRSSGPQSANSLTAAQSMNSDDESYAPTFKQSFSADFDHMFAQMSVSKDQQDDDNPNNGETGGKGKKKKQKGKKQMVLFTTSGQRAN